MICHITQIFIFVCIILLTFSCLLLFFWRVVVVSTSLGCETLRNRLLHQAWESCTMGAYPEISRAHVPSRGRDAQVRKTWNMQTERIFFSRANVRNAKEKMYYSRFSSDRGFLFSRQVVGIFFKRIWRTLLGKQRTFLDIALNYTRYYYFSLLTDFPFQFPVEWKREEKRL